LPPAWIALAPASWCCLVRLKAAVSPFLPHNSKAPFATDAKDAATVAAFAEDLAAHGGAPDAIEKICIDIRSGLHQGRRQTPARGHRRHLQVPRRQDRERFHRAGAPRRTEAARHAGPHPLHLAAQLKQPRQAARKHARSTRDAASLDSTGASDSPHPPGPLRAAIADGRPARQEMAFLGKAGRRFRQAKPGGIARRG
jgi:hypothetical protein